MCVAHRYHPSNYGENCAEFYDQIYGHPPRQLIATLASLAAGGPVLEFGIATGRVSIQLARLGLAVTGIEISSAMLKVLSGKDLPSSLRVVYGDFSEATAPGLFHLIFCIHSTLLLLPPALQRHSFENAAKHLSPSGVFLIEAATPAPEVDLVQTTGRYLMETTSGARNYTVQQYHTSADELDGIASDAGLRLVERWSDWTRAPLVERSLSHISLYVHGEER